MKRAQLETGHGIMDSPPSSSLEEDTPPHGPKSWLPPKQSADESLPEFHEHFHQH